jgi:N-acetylmuramoyl-L-alanine amidase
LKVYLDSGHGGKDSGAVGIGGRLEKDDAFALTSLVADLLNSRGILTFLNTTENETLVEVVNQSNKEKVDLFISIHRNAYSDPKANGLEVWTCKNPRDLTKRNAEIVYFKLSQVCEMNKRGVKESDFYVLKNTKCPAMLLEIGFITNQRDNELFDKYIFDYAEAIAQGVCEILGVNYVQKIYTVQIGTYSDKTKADAVCREARIKGFWETTVIT